MSIRVGILGYGNLGRGVECAVKQNDLGDKDRGKSPKIISKHR